MEGVNGFGEIRLVRLTTVDDQVFKGTLVGNDEKTGKLRLKNVTLNSTRLPGLQNFYASNIKDLELLSEKEKVSATHQDRHKVPTEQRKSPDVLHLRNKDSPVSPQYCLGDYDSVDQGFGSSSDENDNFEDFYEMENYTMICRICDKFRDSIRYLMSQELIAITFYGLDISRKGVLSLIQVATSQEIILYDILRLGSEGFVEGLQAVFESQSVLKIIHDCRMVSDALFHQFGVFLSNVFDTQVGGVFAYRLCNGGDLPRFVDSLSMTLVKQLGLKNEQVHHFFERNRSNQSDEVWLQRPLCNELIQDSLKNLVNMIPLYHTLRAKLMMEFEIGVQMYLDHVRDMPQEKVAKSMSFSHLLPYVFQDLSKHTADYVRENHFYKSNPCFRPSDFMSRENSKTNTSHKYNDRSIKDTELNTSSGVDGKFTPPSSSHSGDYQSWSVKQKSKEVSNSRSSNSTCSFINEKSTSTISPDELSHRLGLTQISEPTVTTAPQSTLQDSVSFTTECAIPSPSELKSRLLLIQEPVKNNSMGYHTDASSGSEGSVPSHSILARSALNQLGGTSYSSASSVYSESLSEPEVEDLRADYGKGNDDGNGWDADKVMELELTKNILQQARQGRSSKVDIQKRLLPSKVKVKKSPKSS